MLVSNIHFVVMGITAITLLTANGQVQTRCGKTISQAQPILASYMYVCVVQWYVSHPVDNILHIVFHLEGLGSPPPSLPTKVPFSP